MPTAAQLDAILYDWHNERLLLRQKEDIVFWQQCLAGAANVAIMGAGTGRVARPLFASVGRLFAVDRSLERLQRMGDNLAIRRIVGEFQSVALAISVEHIVFPYSTLQLVPAGRRLVQTLENAMGQLAAGGILWLDLSDSFDARSDTPWEKVLEAECGELSAVIEEWRRQTHCAQYLEIVNRFYANSRLLHTSYERWYFHAHASLTPIFAGLTAGSWRMQRGYGDRQSEHRRIYSIAKS